MDRLLAAILNDDRPQVEKLLRVDTKIAIRLIEAPKLYESKIPAVREEWRAVCEEPDRRGLALFKRISTSTSKLTAQ